MSAYAMLMTADKQLNRPIIERHVAHLKRLDEAGQLILCGPFEEDGGGLVIFTAATPEAANAVAQADPFIAEGYKTYTLKTLEIANKANHYLVP